MDLTKIEHRLYDILDLSNQLNQEISFWMTKTETPVFCGFTLGQEAEAPLMIPPRMTESSELMISAHTHPGTKNSPPSPTDFATLAGLSRFGVSCGLVLTWSGYYLYEVGQTRIRPSKTEMVKLNQCCYQVTGNEISISEYRAKLELYKWSFTYTPWSSPKPKPIDYRDVVNILAGRWS